LDLALFIAAEDQSLVWRVEREPDHVLYLAAKFLARENFAGLDPKRLAPVRAPSPLDTAAILRRLQWGAFGGFSCRVMGAPPA
jgi:hypothetical protein